MLCASPPEHQKKTKWSCFYIVSKFSNFHFFLFRMLLMMRKKKEVEVKKEITLDMLQPSRYKPNDLEQMAEETKFTKRKSTQSRPRRI